ncbi:hypothetical protein JQ596_30595 [Bradyrhizobium manausense]|uniref:hypothetical protein n=1 Tax=Bradyrhizobium manausense TaxID=989370 RepID=UPI001BAC9BBE|nr:hypothetical protein [Bradyrhizobium manausense]MBR0829887.1 hypothetical protein [Bradyrhizobium manausense]
MVEQNGNAPRRYFVDGHGHRVLIGLSLEETTEFETLEDVSAFGSGHAMRDAGGRTQEVRWRELYAKHELAWKAWIAQSRAADAANLAFVNHG